MSDRSCEYCYASPCECSTPSVAEIAARIDFTSRSGGILDLFAGPGGWDEGLRSLGRTDVLGIEMDADAAATAEAAGHARLVADIRTIDPRRFSDVEGLIASPPCQTFSAAGKGEGKASLDDLVKALRMVADGTTCLDAAVASGLDAGDPRSTLILEPMRFIRHLHPDWIAFEEVKEALPVWEEYANILRDLGYSVWAGILNAADYGVPQTRKRAILIARLHGHAARPTPTHVGSGEWALFDQREPWVTMAAALGWGEAECVAANAEAPPAAVNPDRSLWPLTRPSTTIVRSFRPDIAAAPGFRLPGDGPRQNTPGSIRLTPEQMCRVQGIRTDYPFTANGETKRLSLIGAILPPPWAAHILAPLLRPAVGACVECGNDDPTHGHVLCLDCLEAS